ncbi:MAG: ABC transporter ATP-binding protein [Candidatus Heimdallarchaeaceae archaeon]
MNKPIISFQNFGFKYHLRDDWVLAHINININAGEFIVFSGPNGSGKSTICYSLLGLIPHFYSGETKGAVFIQRLNIFNSSISEIRKLVGYIPQRVENSLVTPYVFTELAFPLEYQNLTEEEIYERITGVSRNLKMEDLLQRNPSKISEGEKQKVGVGCAITNDPQIIVADEPLINLDQKNRKRVLSILNKLKQNNKTIIVATHEFEKYANLADRILFIEGGSVHEKGEIQIDDEPRKLTSSDREKEKKQKVKESEKNVLKIDNLFYKNNENFCLKIKEFYAKKGEIIGITGDNGAGKSTLLKLLTRLLKPISGEITLNGTNISKMSWKELTEVFGIVLQDPEKQFFSENIISEVGFTSANLNRTFEQEDVFNKLKEFNLEKYQKTSPFSLSYGEKRKLSFLSNSFHNPQILLLDEITAGLDSKNKDEIYKQVLEQAKTGTTIIFVSHDLSWVEKLAERTYTIVDGEIMQKE